MCILNWAPQYHKRTPLASNPDDLKLTHATLDELLRRSDFVVLIVPGLNSIEFQLDVQQDFQQSTGHSVRLNTLLKIMLNSLLKFN